MEKHKNIPGQIGLFEFLMESYGEMPEKNVEIKGVIDIETLSDFTIQSTYRDIFLVINMLDDYVKMLTEMPERSFYANYMIGQFERISRELAEQIKLDKEKMYKKCIGKKKDDGIGEDAMVLAAAAGPAGPDKMRVDKKNRRKQ